MMKGYIYIHIYIIIIYVIYVSMSIRYRKPEEKALERSLNLESLVDKSVA